MSRAAQLPVWGGRDFGPGFACFGFGRFLTIVRIVYRQWQHAAILLLWFLRSVRSFAPLPELFFPVRQPARQTVGQRIPHRPPPEVVAHETQHAERLLGESAAAATRLRYERVERHGCSPSTAARSTPARRPDLHSASRPRLPPHAAVPSRWLQAAAAAETSQQPDRPRWHTAR